MLTRLPHEGGQSRVLAVVTWLAVVLVLVVAVAGSAGHTSPAGSGLPEDDATASLFRDPLQEEPQYLWALPAHCVDANGARVDSPQCSGAHATTRSHDAGAAGGAAGTEHPHAVQRVDDAPAGQDDHGAAFRVRVPNRLKGWFQYLVNAQAHIERGRLDDAIDNYQRIIDGFRLPPHDEQAVHLALGRVLVNMSLLTQAQRSFALAAGIPVDQHVPQFWLSVTAAKQGRFEDAASHLRNCLFYAPNFFPALHNLGSMQLIQGDLESGLYYYQKALQHVDHQMVEDTASGMQLEEVLPRMVSHVLSVFKGDRQFTDAQVAATLQLFSEHSSSLDLHQWHLNLGLALANVGAHEEGLRHMRESLQYEVRRSWVNEWLSLAVPPVHRSVSDLEFEWESLSSSIASALYDTQAHYRALYDSFDMYHTTYQLPFMGKPVAQIMSTVGRLSQRSPTISFTSPLLSDSYGLAPTAPRQVLDYLGCRVCSTPVREPQLPTTKKRPHPGEVRSPPLPDRRVLHSRRQAPTSLGGIRVGDGTRPKIRVGILSPQLFDCTTGRFVVALTRHLAAITGKLKRQPGALTPAQRLLGRVLGTNEVSSGGVVPAMKWSPVSPHDTPDGSSTRGDASGGAVRGYARPPALTPLPLPFKVTVVLPRPYGDEVTREILSHAQRLVKLDAPSNVTAWHARLAEERFDVLVVMHDGLSPAVQALLGARVAPVQVLQWGMGSDHALTSGMGDTIDYFVDGDHLVPDAALAQHETSEQLVRLGGLGFWHGIPVRPSPSIIHSAVAKHSLFNARHLYLIPAVLDHIHPAMDTVIGAVLQRDPVGEVMMFYEADQDLWLERVRQRLFANTVVASRGNFRRVRFVRLPPKEELHALAISSDVVLNPFPVGIGALALDLLYFGVPVVSCTEPSTMSRRSVAAAAAVAMGAPELVAGSVDTMIDTAVAIASDEGVQAQLRARLREKGHVLPWSTTPDGGSGSPHTGSDEPLSEPTADQTRTLDDWAAFLQRVGAPWSVQRNAL